VVATNDVTINGMPATVVIGQGNTQQGQVGVWSGFIEMEGKVYNFMGYAPVQAFSQFQRTFESVAAGFAPLRDPNILSVQPARLALTRAERNATFREFIPSVLPRGLTPDGLAIMNQVTLDEVIPAGRVLKLPALPVQPQTPAVPASNVPGWFNRPFGT
jgi:predicted Zn-dependent protease